MKNETKKTWRNDEMKGSYMHSCKNDCNRAQKRSIELNESVTLVVIRRRLHTLPWMFSSPLLVEFPFLSKCYGYFMAKESRTETPTTKKHSKTKKSSIWFRHDSM